MITVAVDCMGGDHGPVVTWLGATLFAAPSSSAVAPLVGLPEAISSFVHERAQIVPANEVVAMDDSVEVALRRKKDRLCALRLSRSSKRAGAGGSFCWQYRSVDGDCSLCAQDL